MQLLSQKEFLESYKNGEKLFEKVSMQFIDISNLDFKGMTIKDSKLLFCTFRNCNFTGVKFINCEIYWNSFYNISMTQTVFDSCKLELTLFDTSQFNNVKMQKCNTRINGILNCNLSGIDTTTSVHEKLITNISQITSQIIDETVAETIDSISRLDVGLRLKIIGMVRADTQRYGVDMPKENKGNYQHQEKNYNDSPLTYGEVKGMIEGMFGPYREKKQYQMKKPYDTGKKYR